MALNFPPNPIAGQIHEDAESGLKFIFQEGGWQIMPKPSSISFSLADMYQRQLDTKLEHPQNGFLEYGLHTKDQNFSGDFRSRHQGVSAWKALKRHLILGYPDKETAADGCWSESKFPVAVIDGIKYFMSPLDPADEFNPDSVFLTLVALPKAEEGKSTYDSASGIFLTHASVANAFAVAEGTNKIVQSRVDFVFLETWMEKVSDKDWVVPYGNVQWGTQYAEMVDFGTNTYKGLTLVRNVVVPEYSAYYQGHVADGWLGGWGSRWSTLTQEQKNLYLSDPANNLFLDSTGDAYQRRFRVRVIKGKGDSWENLDWGAVDPIAYNVALQSFVRIQGKSTSAQAYTDDQHEAWHPVGSGQVLDKTLNTYRPNAKQVSDRQAEWLETNPLAIPMFRVQRRNTGVYDLMLNPSGSAARFHVDGTANTTEWWDANGKRPVTLQNCFEVTDDVGANAAGNVAPFGCSSLEGDAGHVGYGVWPTDIKDMRGYARDIDDMTVLVDLFLLQCITGDNLLGVGWQAQREIVYAVKYYEATATATNLYFDGDITGYVQANDWMLVQNVSGQYQWRRVVEVEYEVGNLRTRVYVGSFTPVPVVNDGWVFFIRDSKFKQSELSYNDLIGDPEYFPREWVKRIDNLSTDGSTAIETGMTVATTGGVLGGGTNNHVYLYLGANATVDLSIEDYSNTANWRDLGVRENYEANRTVPVFPKILDDEDTVLVPDGSPHLFRASKRAIPSALRAGFSVIKSTDRGVTWVDDTAAWTTFLATENGKTLSPAVGTLYLLQYPYASSIFGGDSEEFQEPAVSSTYYPVVYHYSRDVVYMSAGAFDWGGGFVSQLLDRVPDGPDDGGGGITPLGRVTGRDVLDGSLRVEHENITNNLVPSARACKYIVDIGVRGRDYLLVIMANEMRYSQDYDSWQDAGAFTADNATASYTAGRLYKIVEAGSPIFGRVVRCLANSASTVDWDSVYETSEGILMTYAGVSYRQSFVFFDGAGYGADNTVTYDHGDFEDLNGKTVKKVMRMAKLPYLRRSGL